MSLATPAVTGAALRRGWFARHPITELILRRLAVGMLILFLVSILVFAATEVLPGNAAYAVLNGTATPQRVHQLEVQLHLNESAPLQYWHWISHLLTGDAGTSLTNSSCTSLRSCSPRAVSDIVSEYVGNSAILVVLGGVIGTALGVVLGVAAAARRDSVFDHVNSVAALIVTSLPQFVVAIGFVIVFATVVFHWLPAISFIAPGSSPLSTPRALILPVATLVLAIEPYIFRMTRAAMIEALESEYVEMAELKGLPRRRILYVHALKNAIGPIVQVVGLNLIYLAGGVIIVEYVFNYAGIGSALLTAISNRDIPVIQALVLLLAAFYVVVNIIADVIALLATPRRRFPRHG